MFDKREKNFAIRCIESFVVDLERGKRCIDRHKIDAGLLLYLREVAHGADEPVRDARCRARGGGNAVGRITFQTKGKYPRRALHNQLHLGQFVESEFEVMEE